MKKIFTLAILSISLMSCSISNDDDKYICSEKCGKIIKIEIKNNQQIVTFENTCGNIIIDYPTLNNKYNLYVGDSYCQE